MADSPTARRHAPHGGQQSPARGGAHGDTPGRAGEKREKRRRVDLYYHQTAYYSAEPTEDKSRCSIKVALKVTRRGGQVDTGPNAVAAAALEAEAAAGRKKKLDAVWTDAENEQMYRGMQALSLDL